MTALRRLAAAAATVAAAEIAMILAFLAAPGDPAAGVFGDHAPGAHGGALLALDGAPLVERLPRLLAVAIGDPPGYSLRYDGVAVADIVLDGLPATLALCLGALTLATPLATAAGLTAAAHGRRGGLRGEDAAAALFTICLSMPAAALAAGLVFVLALSWRLLPAAGWDAPAAAVMPLLALAIPAFGLIGRAVWALAAETAPAAYVRTARAKGLSRTAAAWSHILPNIAGPLAATLAATFGWTLSGALVIETLFAVPGVGREAVKAVLARDYPVALGCMTALVSLNIVAGLLADLAAWRMDRRGERADAARADAPPQ